MSDAVISDFVVEQKELLNLEVEADSNEQNTSSDERAAHILANLEASDISVGLYGRTVVQLTLFNNEKSSIEPLLPAHRFTVGDEVQIKKQNQKDNPTGVISAVSDSFINVALFQNSKNHQGRNDKRKSKKEDGKDEEDDQIDILNQPPLQLVPMSSIEVHRKMVKALDILAKEGSGHPIAGRVVESMFYPNQLLNQQTNKTDKRPAIIQPFNTNLDQSQLDAISFALQSDKSVALIHGPPGTGKTTTVAELIQQAVYIQGMKVLVTAPSNVAVDNILERLVATPPTQPTGNQKNSKNRTLRAIRLGHPARIKASILKYSLEAQVQEADGTEIVSDVRKELKSYLRVLSNPKSRPNDKRIAYREIKSLRKEIRTREEKVVQEIISTAQVVLATTVGAANSILEKVKDGFDLVVIDEAAQALEASCWIPILRGKKVVLAGDHCQLPPTIKTKNPRAQAGLSRTMFERLMGLYGDDQHGNRSPRISRMLKVQYRMHHDIADWASQAMYGGELETHESVRNQSLSQISTIGKSGSDGVIDDLAETRLLLIDTAGCDYYETVNSAGSRFNQGEANLVTQHVQKLIEMGLDQAQVAIITPYNGQVELLRNLLLHDYPRLEIRSVDGFQGGEREAVILSLVRSSDRGGIDGIGFLKDDRRQNVAVTRAKRHLAVICDSETVCQSKFIQSLLSWIGEHGEHRSALEYAIDTASQDYEADLLSAETELLKISEPNVEPRKEKSTNAGMADEKRRKSLLESISRFAETGLCGEEMRLSSELSSYDRRLVHEFAEQIGLVHRSEGTEGVDRRIVLSIKKEEIQQVDSSNLNTRQIDQSPDEDEDPDSKESIPMASSFNALSTADSDLDTNDEATSLDMEENTLKAIPNSTDQKQSNSMLRQLAMERAERQKSTEKAKAVTTVANAAKKKKNKKKSRGQKLGGKKKVEKKEEETFDDLDDMAFLDAQIQKAQNSHGRKVEGKGNYRTIVNGILNSRPEPPPTRTNTRAAATLKSKLKDAQNSRRPKKKK